MKARIAVGSAMALGPFLTLIRRRRTWRRCLQVQMMLLHRSPRPDCHRWQGPTLPPGCVMVVHYSSR